MRCPRDRQLRNILAYRTFEQKEEFDGETNPVVRCPDCGWIFSPGGEYREMLEVFQRSIEDGAHVRAA